MSLSRDELVRRVETARRWLEQAEHSFHDETPLKGELNLLLAQAEMQKLREDRGMSRQWQQWQRALALVTALVMVSGFGWWWQRDDDAPAPVTAPVTMVKTVPLEPSATWPQPTASQVSQQTPAVSAADRAAAWSRDPAGTLVLRRLITTPSGMRTAGTPCTRTPKWKSWTAWWIARRSS